MTNNEVALIMRLRDEATAVWQKFRTTVELGSASMFNKISKDWKGIAASAFAAWHTIKTLWNFAELFAQTGTLRASFNSMLEGVGLDAERVFKDIMAKSGGLIDDSAILEASNKFLSLNGDAQKLGDLMLIARAKARDLGITATEAFQRITNAVGTGRERSLKQIGITIDLKRAEDDLAASLGKTVSQLTAHEKQQAFLNATLAVGAEAVARQNLEITTLSEKMQQVTAFIGNAKETVGEFAVRGSALILGLLNSIGAAVYELATVILVPFEKLEEGMRALGLTTGFTVRHLREDTQDLMDFFNGRAADSWTAMTASSEALSGALSGLNSVMKGLNEEAEAAAGSISQLADAAKAEREELDKRKVGTEEYRTQLELVTKAEYELGKAKVQATLPGTLARLEAEQSFLQEIQKQLQVGGRAWQENAKQIEAVSQKIKSLDPAELKRVMEEVKKLGIDTQKVLVESANATVDALEVNARRRIDLEEEQTIAALNEEERLKLATVKNAEERIAIEQNFDAKRRAASEKAATDRILEERRIMLAIRDIQDEIERIQLDSGETLAAASTSFESERLDIEKEFALKRINQEEAVALAKAKSAGATDAEIEATHRQFDALREQAATASAVKQRDLTKQTWAEYFTLAQDAIASSLKLLVGLGTQRQKIDTAQLSRRNQLSAIEDQKTRAQLKADLQLYQQTQGAKGISRQEYNLRIQELDAQTAEREKELNDAYAENSKSMLDYLGDIWSKFWQDVVDQAIEQLARLAVFKFLDLIFGGIPVVSSIAGAAANAAGAGAGVAHGGQGLVPAFKHSGGEVSGGRNFPGLRADEVLTILQVGETVRTLAQEKEMQSILAAAKDILDRSSAQRFHEGGTVGSLFPGQSSVDVRRREMVAQSAFQAGSRSPAGAQPVINTTVHVHFNAPTSDEEFVVNSVKKAIQRTGLTVDKLLVDRKNKIIVED